MQYHGNGTHKRPMEPYRVVTYFPSTPKEGCVRQARHPLWVLQGTFAPAKKNPAVGKDKARQWRQDHGSYRRFGSSCRRPRGECFAPRNKTG